MAENAPPAPSPSGQSGAANSSKTTNPWSTVLKETIFSQYTSHSDEHGKSTPWYMLHDIPDQSSHHEVLFNLIFRQIALTAVGRFEIISRQ